MVGGMCRASGSDGWGARASLPRLERMVYMSVWILAVCYLILCVQQVSVEFQDKLNEYDMEPGWSFLARKKDMSNFEWAFWSTWFIQLWPWLAGHIVLGQMMRGFQSMWKRRQAVFTWYSLMALTCIVGPLPALLLVGHCVLVYVVAYCSRTYLVWIVSLLLLSTLNFSPFTDWLRTLAGHDPFDQRFYLLMFATAMINLRYTSAALEIAHTRYQANKNPPVSVKNKQNHNNQRSKKSPEAEKVAGCGNPASNESPLQRLLLHAFYLPLFFTGPLLTYHDFHKQFNQPRREWSLPEKKSWVKQLLRVLFWTLVLELSLHYFYFSSMQHNPYVLNLLPKWALAGVAFSSGQFFMLKYVVMFGVPSVVAQLDQMSTPPGPMCIAHVYLYSDMWKYFDRGLYSLIKRHIYVPLGGSSKGLLRQLFASACCFGYVYYWHGAEEYLLWWVALNLLGIVVESIAARVAEWPSVQACERRWCSPEMSRRIRAVLAVPLLAMSAVAIFHFLGGLSFGQFVFQQLVVNGSALCRATVSVVLYCFIQTSMEIAIWRQKSHPKKVV